MDQRGSYWGLSSNWTIMERPRSITVQLLLEPQDLVERIVRWKIHPEDLVTNRFPLEKANEAYALMATGKSGKVAVVFDEELK